MNQTKLVWYLRNLFQTIIAFIISGGVTIFWLVALRCLVLWRWEWYPGDWGIFFRIVVIGWLLIIWRFLWKTDGSSDTETRN